MTRPDRNTESPSMDVVTMRVADQRVGIAVLSVHEVLGPRQLTRVPLAPACVAGARNVRGRIVTVLDLRVVLGLAAGVSPAQAMNVVINHGKDVYALLVDEIGDVLTIQSDALEPPPRTLDASWRAVIAGIARLDDGLLPILSAERLLPQLGGGAHGDRLTRPSIGVGH